MAVTIHMYSIGSPYLCRRVPALGTQQTAIFGLSLSLVFYTQGMVGIDDLIHVKIQNLKIIAIIYNLFSSSYLGLSFVVMKNILPNLCFKQFVVTNCSKGATRLKSKRNSKNQSFDTKRYIKRIGFLC